MCGINGFAGDFGQAGPGLIERMNVSLAHRGPDDHGVYVDASGLAGLGHRRLSILDLSAAGRQPMSDPRGLVHLVFNGEIFNFPELRAKMEGRGHAFRSRTDTEVLIYLYLEYGERMLERLNGMFAFAIWDTRTRTLFAARDHFGIKPFYYSRLSGGRLLFSSEVKGLLASPDVPRELNPPALSDYLSFLWVSDPLTMFRGVEKLPPAHKLRWRDGRVEVERWWDLDDAAASPFDRPEDELAEELATRLDEAVRRQLLSDVPVGAFLSGGVDSSAIAALMARNHGGEVRCYTMSFNSGDNAVDRFTDDLPYARTEASRLGVSLKEVRATPDIASLWPKMVWHLDEPIADPAAINCYLIAKLAREDGTKVLLSGQGADELFAGYRWHLGPELMRRLSWLPGSVGRAIARGLPASTAGPLGATMRRAQKLLSGAGLDETDQFVLYCQWTTRADRASLLHPAVAEGVAGRDTEAVTRDLLRLRPAMSPLQARLSRDIKTFLPALNLTYTDKTTMAVGLEARVPFLDVPLAEFAARVPPSMKLKGGVSKYILKKSLKNILPGSILNRPKSGFGVPLRKWVRHDLKEMVDDLLSESCVRRRGLFRWEEVERVRREVDRGRGDHAYLLWALLTLEIWHQTFIDAPPARKSPGPRAPLSVPQPTPA